MIFSYLNRNAVHEERHYGMPTDQIVEIGTYRIAGIEEMPGIRPAAFLSSYFFPGKGMREWTLDRRPGKWIVKKNPPRKCRAEPNRSSFRSPSSSTTNLA